MPFFPSLPKEAGVRAIWDRFNIKAWEGLSIFSRSFMHTDSMLNAGEKEMIAAYVSKLNESEYCYAGHSRVAINKGIAADIFDPLVQDLEGAPIKDEMRPLLRFIRKLTLRPSEITQEDADEVFAAGWDEQSFHEAILVCARFSMMNRITIGHGLVVDEEKRARDAKNMNYV
ncbi:MAG: hypothetical protein VW226_11250 [Rhodospirillaceae bacterium]